MSYHAALQPILKKQGEKKTDEAIFGIVLNTFYKKNWNNHRDGV